MVDKLPSDFPIAKWDSMNTKEQFNTIRRSGLNDQEQWSLLNASTPLEVLSLVNAAQKGAITGQLTARAASELTDGALRYFEARHQLVNSDSSILSPLQKRILHGKLDEVFANLKERAEGGSNEDGDNTLYDWSKEKDHTEVQPFPFSAPIPVLKDVPYPVNGEIAYVFFTNSKGAMFKKQAQYQKKLLESQGYEVKLVQTDDVDVFTREWDNMDPKTTTAVVISHSNGMSLIFEDDSSTNAISATGRNRQNEKIASIRYLSGPEIAELYIYACNAGHEELLASEGTNVADAFRDLSNVDTVYAFDGSVSFGPSCLFRTTFEPRLSNAQSYDDVFSWFNIPDAYGESGPSGLLEFQSED
ncbi:MAG: hypothetical protein LLF75_11910 [Eubacteriales bacterium]|nr:hypothetical protein [Eubacteriales bacterium]